jgi:hypothetical protein
VEEVRFVDAANDGGSGSHRADEANQDEREQSDADQDPAAVEEEVSDATTNVARMDLDLDHG